MAVKRIVANIQTPDPELSINFYQDILGLNLLMDHGFIKTFGNQQQMDVQISFANEGGSGTPVPELSIEVDNFEEILKKFQTSAFPIIYGPAEEPWGVKRFFVKDPFGKLVNILTHLNQE